MNFKQIKQGQPCSFSYRGTSGRHKGHMFKYGKKLYICHDLGNASGNEAPYKLGHKFSWEMDIKEGEVLIGSWLNQIRLLKGDCKVVAVKDIKAIGGWHFTQEGDRVMFGCGEVTLTKEQIRTFIGIHQAMEHRNVKLTKLDWDVLKSNF